MFLLTQALTAALFPNHLKPGCLDRLPAALDDLVGRAGDLPQRLGGDPELERIFYLGSSPFYGVANEAMLKMKGWSRNGDPDCTAHSP
jgi:fructoselysine-6-P-deglycase FrlB-like protein